MVYKWFTAVDANGFNFVGLVLLKLWFVQKKSSVFELRIVDWASLDSLIVYGRCLLFLIWLTDQFHTFPDKVQSTFPADPPPCGSLWCMPPGICYTAVWTPVPHCKTTDFPSWQHRTCPDCPLQLSLGSNQFCWRVFALKNQVFAKSSDICLSEAKRQVWMFNFEIFVYFRI